MVLYRNPLIVYRPLRVADGFHRARRAKGQTVARERNFRSVQGTVRLLTPLRDAQGADESQNLLAQALRCADDEEWPKVDYR